MLAIPLVAMEDVLAYIDGQRARFVQELGEWVKIPAISSDPAHKADMLRNAEHLMAELRTIGMQNVQLWPTGPGGSGHPAVFAERIASPDRPTLLVYGHHDVQPVDPLDQWISPPFEPTLRDGRMWGRGVVDDKGQVHIHLKAIESFLRTRGELPVNLKLIVEGEEEIGSANLDALLAQKTRELEADFVCVSDTAMFGRGIPSLCVGLRGMAYLEVHVTGPSTDQHSGTFGGGIANPVNVLARLIAKLHDDDGRITIPGFYDRVRALGQASSARRSPRSPSTRPRGSRPPALRRSPARRGTPPSSASGRVPRSTATASSAVSTTRAPRPSCRRGRARRSACRLVPDQEPEEIATRQLGTFLQRSAPPGRAR